jgi:hypothetical protein
MIIELLKEKIYMSLDLEECKNYYVASINYIDKTNGFYKDRIDCAKEYLKSCAQIIHKKGFMSARDNKSKK